MVRVAGVAIASSVSSGLLKVVSGIGGGLLLALVLVGLQRRWDRAVSGAGPVVSRAARKALTDGRLPDDPAVRKAVRLMLPGSRRQLVAIRRWTLGISYLSSAGMAILGVLIAVVGRRPVMLVMTAAAVMPVTTARAQIAGIKNRYDRVAEALESTEDVPPRRE